MQVTPNQLVELHLEGSGRPQVFRTRVEDVYDDVLVVGAPLQKGHLVPIRVGTRLHVEFKISTTIQEGRFRNEAVVEKRFSTTIPLLQLRLLGQWTKTQERMFVRVPVFLDAVFMPIQDGDGLGQDSEAHTGIILNLSGGGFLLRASYPFQPNDLAKVSFYIEEHQIVTEAEVARMIPTEEGNDFGFQFLELPEQMRTTIIRFVYKRQIELAEKSREKRVK